MPALMRYEWYKTAMSRSMIGMLFILLVLAVFLYGFSLGSFRIDEVYAVSEELAENDPEIMAFIDDVKKTVAPEAVYEVDGSVAFRAAIIDKPDFGSWGSILYDRYRSSPVMSRFQPMLQADMLLFGKNETDVFEKGAFVKAMTDASFPAFCCIIFAAFFFGRDFKKRTVNGAVYSGYGKGRIFASKLISFYLLSLLVSVAALFIALFTYIPSFVILPKSYVLRCTVIWLILNLGAFSIPVVFPFIFRDVLKSMVCSFLFMAAFLSNRAIVHIDLLDYGNKALWLSDAPAADIALPAVKTLAALIVSTVASYALFRRAELK